LCAVIESEHHDAFLIDGVGCDVVSRVWGLTV